MDVVLHRSARVRRAVCDVGLGSPHANQCDGEARPGRRCFKPAKDLVAVPGPPIIIESVAGLAGTWLDLGPLLFVAFLSPTALLPYRRFESCRGNTWRVRRSTPEKRSRRRPTTRDLGGSVLQRNGMTGMETNPTPFG